VTLIDYDEESAIRNYIILQLIHSRFEETKRENASFSNSWHWTKIAYNYEL